MKVELRTRRMLGAPYTVHELVIDGHVVRAQLGPFGAEEIAALARRGAPLDAAKAPLRGRPDRRRPQRGPRA